MSDKSLRELGEEYESAAAIIKERIAAKRKQLRELKESICSNEAYVLKSELKTLYAEQRETREIAEYLKTYYDPHEGKKEIFSYK
ncbi:MAG: hypothetical protein IKJ41_03535 [Clostridia bacterium]|nr:hypothetical protein [Clostridia bacterium]